MTSKGLSGVVAAETAVSRVDGEHGTLIFRGYNVWELGGQATYEEVVYLLWQGELPTQTQLDSFKAELAARRELPMAVLQAMQSFPKQAHPMAVLRTAVSWLGMADPTADDTSQTAAREKAMSLTAVFPTIVAAWEQIRQGNVPIAPRQDLSHAANFLYMLNGQWQNPDAVNALDAYLVLLADHDFNASTFASRVTTGTQTDIYSAVTTAIGTLKGMSHGGANQKAMEQFIEAAEAGDVAAWYQQKRAAGQRIMGIGHREYKVVDPRARVFRPLAERLANSSGQGQWFVVADQIEQLTRQDPYFIERNLYANVDYYSAVALYMIGIPVDQFTAVFAISRIAGWAAHIQEQLVNNRLIRPQAQYVGPQPRPYVPIKVRNEK
jgi:citrate synthase